MYLNQFLLRDPYLYLPVSVSKHDLKPSVTFFRKFACALGFAGYVSVDVCPRRATLATELYVEYTVFCFNLAKIYLAAAAAGNAPPAKFWISKFYIWLGHRLKMPRVRNYDFTNEFRLWLYICIYIYIYYIILYIYIYIYST